MTVDKDLKFADLKEAIDRFWETSGTKIRSIERDYDSTKGAPVYTVNGKYTARGWTEWTQGFQYGSALLQFDATGDEEFLALGREKTLTKMAHHLTHRGVHDHGFNNVSTYGNLLRLMNEGRIERRDWEKHFYELALKVSGAVQASRWSKIHDGGFIYSFNGPHSLFVDTIRSCRSLLMAHLLGQSLGEENDQRVSLLQRAALHLSATARYAVYYGEGRDAYDIRGRTAHESVFNMNDGRYRCPNSQQGYSPFSTWTRGLAWAMLGFAEQLECFHHNNLRVDEMATASELNELFLKAATATCDFYVDYSAEDGIPYWDTGAPGLVHLGNYLERPSDPFNDFEPVDSSAATIAAQALLRLGHYLRNRDPGAARKYTQAGLTVSKTLLGSRYLSSDPKHQGLILHAVYHRPAGWDHVPKGKKAPCNESTMWGDYHGRELALYLQRMMGDAPYYKFWP